MKQSQQQLQPFFSPDLSLASLFGDVCGRDRAVAALGQRFQSITLWMLFDFSHCEIVADSVGYSHPNTCAQEIPKSKAASGSRCGFWLLNLSRPLRAGVQYSF